MESGNQLLRESVRTTATRPEVIAAIEQVYDEIEQKLQEIKPVCQMSGRCCRFEEYGHRLFVTTAELATFAARLREHPELSGFLDGSDGGSCRFQDDRACVAHPIRPMGCRLFFCDDRTEAQMQSLYEEMHRKVREIHDRYGVPYFYVEWRQGLASIAE